MPVNAAKRVEVAAALAAVMRGEIGRDEIESLRQRLFPDGRPADDMLAMHALARLDGPLVLGVWRSRLRVTLRQWEKLRRWIAILNTDLDWDDSAYAPVATAQPSRDWIGCLALPLTLALLVAASRIADGWPVVIWVAIGLILSPVCVIYVVWHSFSERKPKPFASVEQMSRFIDRAEAYDLPAYDRRVHGPSVIAQFANWLSGAIMLLLFAAAFVAIWPAMLILLWQDRDELRE